MFISCIYCPNIINYCVFFLRKFKINEAELEQLHLFNNLEVPVCILLQEVH